MGLFSRNFDRPGPGVPKDMPRKTGTARFFELLFRDFADYVKMSFLISLAVLPSAVMFILGTLPFLMGTGELYLIFLLFSLVLAFPVGGAMTACYFNITRFMRDEPSYLWFEFKRKFKENWKQSAITGIVCTAFVYMQILLWFSMYYQMVAEVYDGGVVLIALAVLSLLLFAMITPYIFLHFAYIDLKTGQILKNSFLMSLARLPKSFMGALLGGIIWVLIALFMPNSLIVFPLVPIILAALSMLLTLTWIWPPFNAYFEVEEKLIAKKAEREAYEITNQTLNDE